MYSPGGIPPSLNLPSSSEKQFWKKPSRLRRLASGTSTTSVPGHRPLLVVNRHALDGRPSRANDDFEFLAGCVPVHRERLVGDITAVETHRFQISVTRIPHKGQPVNTLRDGIDFEITVLIGLRLAGTPRRIIDRCEIQPQAFPHHLAVTFDRNVPTDLNAREDLNYNTVQSFLAHFDRDACIHTASTL